MSRRWTRVHDVKLRKILDLMRVEARPFADSSEQAVASRKSRPFDDWCHTYLPHWFRAPSTPMHLEADDLVEERGMPIFLNWFRGSGKSTRYSIAKPLHWILHREQPFIIAGGRDEEVAADKMDFIRQELNENPRIRADYGENISPVLGNNEATDWVAVDTRMWARGIGQSPRGQLFRGSRPTAFIGDDLEDDELAKNPKREDKLWDWIFAGVFPALEGAGAAAICVLLLNTYGRGCLADRAQKQSLERDKTGRPLCLYVRFEADDGSGKSLWPERYSDAALARSRAIIGERIYRKEMRCIVEDLNASFRPDWVKNFLIADFRRELALVRAACDPSARAGEQNDFKSIVVLARYKDDRRSNCLHAWIRHASAAELLERVIWVWDHFQPGLFGCEANGFQALIWPLLELDEKLKGRIETVGLFPITHTGSKEDRILRTAPKFEQGLCSFDPSEGDQRLLIDQFLDYGKPGVHDDGPDAWEMADSLFPRAVDPRSLRPVIFERETMYEGILA